jgi:hypothetical protein
MLGIEIIYASLLRSSETGIMSEEEWVRVQGMTYSELRRGSSVGSFLDEWEDKYKKK